jgi:hypothetical protein
VTDPRLDWRPFHDPRSKAFPVRDALWPFGDPRERMWSPGPAVLDQGREGACVGFAWAAELAASPFRTPGIDDAFAHDLYQEAQVRDEWPGEDYEGTSVLAGAKAAQARGYIGGYRWAFSIDELRDAVINLGPAVIGIPWRDGMYDTRPSGLLDVTGRIVGGHAILVRGYHPRMRIRGEGWFRRHDVFVLRNSWGEGYGKHGDAYVRTEDLAALLANEGEACIPLSRSRLPKGAA